jgi:hypothetical protein
LENIETNLVSLLELSELVKQLKPIRIGFGIRVTNIITGEQTIYDSMRAVSKDIEIDNKGLKEKSLTSKLYKRKYNFKFLY